MGGDLTALVVALALGSTVVILGLRRDLSKTTRAGLPRFDGGSERESAAVGPYEGEQWPRRPLSRGERRWLVSVYLLMALLQAASAIRSADDRLIHAGLAVLFMLAIVVFLRRNPPEPPAG